MKTKTDKPNLIPRLRFPEFQNSGEWEVKRLGEVFNLQDGYSFSSKDFSSEENDESYQVVRITEINNKNKNEDKVYISSETAKKIDLECFKIIKGDLLLSLTGAAGFNFFIWKDNKKAFLNQRTLKLIPKDENNDSIKYLAEPLLFKKINSLGTGQNNNLSKSILEQIKIPLPSLPEQQKIASCLSSLDEVIAGERQRLELLNAHKKGLLQNLFPREGETVPKLRFPEFQGSGEWVEKKLGEICRMQAGKFISATEIKEINSGDLFPCYGGNGLRGYTNTYTNVGVFPLIGRQGAHCGNVTLAIGKFYATEHAVVAKPLENIDTIWLYYVLGYLNLNQYATGQAQPGLSVTNLESVELMVTQLIAEQQKIASCLSSLDDLIQAQEQKIEWLEQHKKGLLQGLFPNVNDGDNG